MHFMVDLLCVDPPLVAGIWPHTREMVKRGMSRAADGDFERTERELFAGLRQLWLVWNGTAIEAVVVTQLTTISGKKFCVIVACNGHGMKRWLHLISGLEQFAKDEGCHAMRIIGRRGWERALENYRVKQVILDKELK
jgi:hypothetical protein